MSPEQQRAVGEFCLELNRELDELRESIEIPDWPSTASGLEATVDARAARQWAMGQREGILAAILHMRTVQSRSYAALRESTP